MLVVNCQKVYIFPSTPNLTVALKSLMCRILNDRDDHMILKSLESLLIEIIVLICCFIDSQIENK
jgi:hypothetical protein